MRERKVKFSFFTRCFKLIVIDNCELFFLAEFNTEGTTCIELNKLVKCAGDQNVINMVELKEKHTIGCLNALIRFLNVSSIIQAHFLNQTEL